MRERSIVNAWPRWLWNMKHALTLQNLRGNGALWHASIETLKILRHNQGSPPPKPSVLPSNTFSAHWPPSFLWERDDSLCCHDLSICNAGVEGAALDRIVVVTGSRLRRLASKNGDVGSAVAVEIFHAPCSLSSRSATRARLRGSSGRKLNSSVSMMEPAKDGMRNNVSEPPDVEQRGTFSGQDGSSNRLGGPFRECFYPSEISGAGSDGEFLDQHRGFHPAA